MLTKLAESPLMLLWHTFYQIFIVFLRSPFDPFISKEFCWNFTDKSWKTTTRSDFLTNHAPNTQNAHTWNVWKILTKSIRSRTCKAVQPLPLVIKSWDTMKTYCWNGTNNLKFKQNLRNSQWELSHFKMCQQTGNWKSWLHLALFLV